MDGEEYQADMSTLASPASQGSPDVYILPLTEVSLPVAKQPARSGESLQFNLLNSTNSIYCKQTHHVVQPQPVLTPSVSNTAAWSVGVRFNM